MTTTPTGRSAISAFADVGDYGGAPDKRDSETEGSTPYAWLWYQELQALRGSAYSTAAGALVNVENLALGRLFGWVWSRLPEALWCNSTPLRSDARLGYWASVLGIRQRDGEQPYETRRKCAAKYRLTTGPTEANVDAAIEELMGSRFVSTIKSVGADLATPPAITYWPTINPGPAAYDLGAGCWASERAHLGVLLVKPEDAELSTFLQLANVDLFDLLDGLLPCWATFDWATSDGFLLDISQLDFDGITP